MKRILRIIFVNIALLFSFSPLHAQTPITLRECYELALRRSERVDISQEEIEKARARFIQALGQQIPIFSFQFSTLFQQSASDPTSSSISRTVNPSNRTGMGFSVTLPLFHGFREIALMRSARLSEKQNRFLKENVERLLYADVATAFFTVARVEIGIQTTERILKVLRGRSHELQTRVSLGKARSSEKTSQDADISLLEADLEKRKGDLQIAYEMLSFLTGLDPHPKILLKDPLLDKPMPKEFYTNHIEERGDVKVAIQAIEIYKQDIRVRRSGLLPRVDAQVNLYPYRNSTAQDIHWDAGVTVGIPLFSLTPWGDVREGKANLRQAELRLSETRRIAKDEVERAYISYYSSLSQFRKYSQAVGKAELSYRQQTEDYQRSLVTNLDVLQSQRIWLEALRLREDVRAQAWSNWVQLQIASGVAP